MQKTASSTGTAAAISGMLAPTPEEGLLRRAHPAPTDADIGDMSKN